MHFSFSYQNRLTQKQQFDHIFKFGEKVPLRYLLAFYLANNLTQARLGIILPKQKLKLAVKRNRFRRIIRESFRYHQEMLKGLDIIVLMRSECTDHNNCRGMTDKLWQMISDKIKPV